MSTPGGDKDLDKLTAYIASEGRGRKEYLQSELSDEDDERPLNSTIDLENYCEEIFDYLVDAVMLLPIIKVHHFVKVTGLQLPVPAEIRDEPAVVDDFDIFGSTRIFQSRHQKNMDVFCGECKRTIAASRFAPHLEKCIGMGRNSSRVARRKINQTMNYTNSLKASSSTGRLRESSGRDSDVERSDEDSRQTLLDDDDDWVSSSRRPARRVRKTKAKSCKTKNEYY